MKVLISGSSGTIGRVLLRGLAHEVTEFDLPECDARSLNQFAEWARGHDALVHLAWNTSTENSENGALDVDNALMVYHAYRAAKLSGVRRVVMASSVHADRATDPSGALLATSGVPTPRNPYGASKVFAEALGRHFVEQGLEVVAVRFGGVDHRASVRDFGSGARPPEWLSHADCVELVDACITAPEIPGGYAVLYGVSDNPSRVHDVTNPFGWAPQPLLSPLEPRLRSLRVARRLEAIARSRIPGGWRTRVRRRDSA